MLGLDHTVDPAAIPEEAPAGGEHPTGYSERLARRKAAAVAARHPDALVLAADTVVVRDGRVLGKPASAADAVETLLSLAGRVHSVVTGLALARPGTSAILSRVDVAEVRFRSFDRIAAEAYVATGEPMDKAGAYGIQGLGSALVSRVEGDYYTVVGLSVHGLLRLLEEAGFRYAFPGLGAVEGSRARPRPPTDGP
jgi:septum formation protein